MKLVIDTSVIGNKVKAVFEKDPQREAAKQAVREARQAAYAAITATKIMANAIIEDAKSQLPPGTVTRTTNSVRSKLSAGLAKLSDSVKP